MNEGLWANIPGPLRSPLRSGLFALLLILAAGSVYLVVPDLLVGQCDGSPVWWEQLARLECEKGRAALLVEERRNMLAVLAGLLAVVTLVYTHRRQQLSQDENRTSRYTQAVEQLGHTNQAVRMGGIYALERLAKDSPKDRSSILEVMCAFVRHSSWESVVRYENARRQEEAPDRPRVTIEVEATVQVLGRLNRLGHAGLLNLSGAQLREARLSATDLSYANLTEADLTGAYLTKASLHGSNLVKARLVNAHLTGADLSRANLAEANLAQANLVHANLRNADLTGADLGRTNLRDAILFKATLVGANLGRAHLRRADLTSADLGSADLSGAILSSATLTDAQMDHASMTREQFDSAVGGTEEQWKSRGSEGGRPAAPDVPRGPVR